MLKTKKWPTINIYLSVYKCFSPIKHLGDTAIKNMFFHFTLWSNQKAKTAFPGPFSHHVETILVILVFNSYANCHQSWLPEQLYAEAGLLHEK